MFPSYDSDVIDFKMFKFKDKEAFDCWIDNYEFSAMEYAEIDPVMPFVGSMCQRNCLNEDMAIYDVCNNSGKPLGNTMSIAFNSEEIDRYLDEVPFTAHVMENVIKAKEEEILQMKLELEQLREQQKLL